MQLSQCHIVSFSFLFRFLIEFAQVVLKRGTLMPFLFRSTTSFFYTDIYTTPSFSFSFTRNLALEFHDIESFVDIM